MKKFLLFVLQILKLLLIISIGAQGAKSTITLMVTNFVLFSNFELIVIIVN
jgi:hypothetical protein